MASYLDDGDEIAFLNNNSDKAAEKKKKEKKKKSKGKFRRFCSGRICLNGMSASVLYIVRKAQAFLWRGGNENLKSDVGGDKLMVVEPYFSVPVVAPSV